MRKIFLAKTSCLLCLVALLPSCAGNTDAAESADGLVIPFVIEDGFMIVEAVINGKAGRFMFDSGADASFVPEARMSLPLTMGTRRVNGRIGIVPAYGVRSVEFANGNVRAFSWLTRATEGVGIRSGTDGILGNGIFAGYWVEFSFSRNEIVLHQEFPERFAQAFHSPLSVRSRNQLNLTIDVDGREFLMNFDTGMNHALYFSDAIAGGMGAADLRRIASNGEIGDFHLMRTNSISIMDMEYSNKLIMGNSYAGARNTSDSRLGLMGINFMRHYDLLLDYRTIRLYLTNDDSAGMFFIPIVAPEEREYGFFSFLDAAPDFGIIQIGCDCGCGGRWGCCDGGPEIRSVLADSEAYALGLRPGAPIVAIDRMPHTSFAPEDVSNPFFFDDITEITTIIDGAEVVLRRER